MSTNARSYDILKKLGWINTSSRKILLVRYLHRIFPDLLTQTETVRAGSDATHLIARLHLYRFALEATTDAITHKRLVNAPYEPTDKPNRFFLRGGKSGISFRLEAYEAYPLIAVDGDTWGFSIRDYPSNSLPARAFEALADEIYHATKGTNLSTKRQVDERTTILVQSSIDTLSKDSALRILRPRTAWHIPTEKEHWRWWQDWRSSVVEGRQTNGGIAEEILSLDDHLWTDGDAPEKIAIAIETIEARLLSERLPQVEDVYQTDDGLYEVRTVHKNPANLIESVENRVRFALDMAVKSNACDMSEMSTAAKILRHALDACMDDPNALEQYLRQASALIKARVADGSFSDDDELQILTGTLDELALQLRADHPDVAAAVDARSRQRLRELEEPKRLEAARLIADMREGTAPRLNTEFAHAAEVVEDGSSPDATADALKLSGNRAAKISLAERAKKAEGSGVMAGVKIGMRANKLVEFVMGLFSGGGV